MNATEVLKPREIPAFLLRNEPQAQFAYWSSGRLQIVKDEVTVSLSPDDLQELRRFVTQFDKDDAQ